MAANISKRRSAAASLCYGMVLDGFVHPEDLRLLTEALERYRRTAEMVPDTPAYQDAGARIVALFQSGVSTVGEILDRIDYKRQASPPVGATKQTNPSPAQVDMSGRPRL